MTEQMPLTPPDPSGLEAWIRQVLRLAGPRASAHIPPLPATGPGVSAVQSAEAGPEMGFEVGFEPPPRNRPQDRPGDSRQESASRR
ncbi:hypothetical protein [Sphaerimonospora thailandensis]|uniref:Uncharacterized protein n=1 Tax=Sphaerimonospora thailandensis TaxID=795644 RepID=A0A8J3W0P8_9ACTN|nr:hypothetical protein [Sphaerimonospora thailandensis]GIH72454.1 hypothetical protein Mth01_47070 [Sphaerimonospora thailandensis]